MGKILGIDPGTVVTGWGIIEEIHNAYKLVAFGVIKNKPKLSPSKKYLNIHNEISLLVEEYAPDALSIETQFVDKNVQSAIKLGMARGVAIVAAAKHDVPIYEYTPSKAKRAVTGNGNATKGQVGQMIKILLNLKEIPSPEDAADALALAITHSHYQRRALCTNI